MFSFGTGTPSGGFSFGTTTPSTGSGLFGSSASGGSGFSFGTPSSGGGSGFSFGTPSSGGGSAFSFGTPSGGSSGSSLWPSVSGGSGMAASALKSTPEQAFTAICQAVGRESASCRFVHVYYNVVNPADIPKHVKPGNMQDPMWIQACKENPDPTRLVPVLARGYVDLKKRVEAQDKMTKAHQEALQQIQRTVQELLQQHELTTLVQVEAYKREHMQLATRLLKVIKRVEVLRNMGTPIAPSEEALRKKLDSLLRDLHKPTQYKSLLHELSSSVQMQEDTQMDTYEPLDEDAKIAIFKFLRQQQEGLVHLTEVLKRDIKDLNTISKRLAEEQQ